MAIIILTIFLIGSLTILTSLISLRIIYKTPALHNVFGYLCAAQSTSEVVIGGCFALWATPVALLGIPQNTGGFVIGQILTLSFYLCLWLHLCKSFNRSYAIVFPIQYRNGCKKVIKKLFIVITIAVTLICGSTALPYSCNYYFDSTIYMWKNRDQNCWEMLFVVLPATWVTIIGCVIFDMTTFAYLILFKKRVKQKQTINGNIEKKFFIQTCLSTIIYIFTTLSLWKFVDLAEAMTMKILLTTVTWQLFHLINEILFVAFSIKTRNATIKTHNIQTVSKTNIQIRQYS